MRYRELINEVLIRSSPDRLSFLPIMYGYQVLDGELEAEELEALRLDNEKKRVDVARAKAELADPLRDSLVRAKIQKTQAEIVAKLGGL